MSLAWSQKLGGSSRAGVVLALCMLLLALARPLAAQPSSSSSGPFSTEAEIALLVDVSSDTILFSKNADVPMPPASLAKLMTAAVVFDELRSGYLRLTDPFLVSEHAWRTGGAPARTAAMFADVNSRVPVGDLLRGLLVQGGNDAAIALAEGMAGSEAAFAERMNKKARELGLDASVFVNPSGLPAPGQETTASDLARLAEYLIEQHPDYYRIFSEPEFTWNKIRQRNRNPLLGSEIGADGLGTGFTEGAGYAIVASATRGGQRLVAVLGGLKSEAVRASEARKILAWGFDGFEARALFGKDEPVAEARVFGGDSRHVPLAAQEPITLLVPRNSGARLSARVVYEGPVPAPVAKGSKLGTLRVFRDDTLALEVPLVAAADVGRGTLTQRALDAVLEMVASTFARAIASI